MIVVDTSVWVDFFRDNGTWQVEHLTRLITDDEPVAFTDIVLTEILQGLPDDRQVRRVERRLLAFDVLRLEALDDFAALRRSTDKREAEVSPSDGHSTV